MQKKKVKDNEREKLSWVKRKKCVQKEFDRADIVRDVRLCDFGLPKKRKAKDRNVQA